MLRLLVLALALSVLASHARAAPPHPAHTERVLAAVERDLAHNRPDAAAQRLARALPRARNLFLILRYAELSLAPRGPLTAARLALLAQSAHRYLTAYARVGGRDGDAEVRRRSALEAAWAEALLGRDEASLARVAEAGRREDSATVRCLQRIAALAAYDDHLARAEEALTMARNYVPQDLALAAELAAVQLARGRTHAALPLLGERFAIAPTDLAARRDLAYALAAQGRAQEGLALLSAERAVCESTPGCVLEASRIALEAGQLREAVRLAARRLADDARDLDALFVTAEAHAHSGELDEARAVYARILAVRPESVRARQALEALDAQAQPDAAVPQR